MRVVWSSLKRVATWSGALTQSWAEVATLRTGLACSQMPNPVPPATSSNAPPAAAAVLRDRSRPLTWPFSSLRSRLSRLRAELGDDKDKHSRRLSVGHDQNAL